MDFDGAVVAVVVAGGGDGVGGLARGEVRAAGAGADGDDGGVDFGAVEDGVVEPEVGGVQVEIAIGDLVLELWMGKRALVAGTTWTPILRMGKTGSRYALVGRAVVFAVWKTDLEIALDSLGPADEARRTSPGVVCWLRPLCRVGWIGDTCWAEGDFAESAGGGDGDLPGRQSDWRLGHCWLR